MSKDRLRDPEQWLPRDIFAAYCGPGSDKLLAYYDKAKAKRQLVVMELDWLAILALPAWLGYRRQWTIWATLVVLIALLSAVEAFAHIDIPAGAFGGAMLGLGLMARGLLLTNANGLYLKLKDRGLAPEAIRAALANKASPNVGLAVAGALGAIAVDAGVALLLPA